ncbi:DUF6095 family protein [Aquimarina spongiae]|uniref:Uncharacterized protein n=1 Tax=Aquimarina spongiae TaxID=570521 RepID=A0A1M6G0V7_9FLAO|nr:DUF6095 family protein [Aquimarina spongiae]SHJ03601.1 hypothetical protein SAMN04488508_10510 [Aquimarina spongiae]
MEPKRTDKQLLGKGIQRMAMALLFMFISPVIIHSAFKNQDHPWYIPILILGLLGAGFAIFMAFKGLRTIMESLFGKK